MYSYKTVNTIDISNMVDTCIACDWSYSVQSYNCLHFGDRVDANQMVIQLSLYYNNGNTHIEKLERCSATLEREVYVFFSSLDNQNTLDHSDDIIELRNNMFDSGGDVNHPLESPRVIGIVSENVSTNSNIHKYTEEIVLDLMFPEMEQTSLNNEFSFFGQQFGVPFQSDNKLWYARSITSTELLSIYSIKIDTNTILPTN